MSLAVAQWKLMSTGVRAVGRDEQNSGDRDQQNLEASWLCIIDQEDTNWADSFTTH